MREKDICVPKSYFHCFSIKYSKIVDKGGPDLVSHSPKSGTAELLWDGGGGARSSLVTQN